MKPSERRALEADKRAREAAEYREKELRKQAEKAQKAANKDGNIEYRESEYSQSERLADTERVDMNATFKKLPEKEIEVKGDGYHRESFFSNNVRLIAFIVTAAVALFVIGPLGYDIYLNVSDYMDGRGNEVKGGTLTETGVIALAEKGKNLTWKELVSFEHTSMGDGNSIEIDVEGTGLILRAERIKDNAYPYVVRLIDYNSGEYIDDIRYAKADKIKSFIASPTLGDEVEEGGEVEGKAMTKKDLIALAEKGSSLIWKDFEEYGHTSTEGGTVMEIEVLGTGTTLRVWRNKDRTYPIFVRLTHNASGEYLDDVQYAKDGEIEKFIASHTSKD